MIDNPSAPPTSHRLICRAVVFVTLQLIFGIKRTRKTHTHKKQKKQSIYGNLSHLKPQRLMGKKPREANCSGEAEQINFDLIWLDLINGGNWRQQGDALRKACQWNGYKSVWTTAVDRKLKRRLQFRGGTCEKHPSRLLFFGRGRHFGLSR